jgi:hypothetical protein
MPRPKLPRWLTPRFSLRTLFALVTIASVPMGWVAYHLNWIHQRHAFLELDGVRQYPRVRVTRPFPWGLRLLAEEPRFLLGAGPEQLDRAKDLFPESILNLVYPQDLTGIRQPH